MNDNTNAPAPKGRLVIKDFATTISCDLADMEGNIVQHDARVLVSMARTTVPGKWEIVLKVGDDEPVRWVQDYTPIQNPPFRLAETMTKQELLTMLGEKLDQAKAEVAHLKPSADIIEFPGRV